MKQFIRIFKATTAIFNMIKLAWLAQPMCFVGLILLELINGLLPPATAWFTKVLFDLIVHAVQEPATVILRQNLLFILAVLALLSVASQLSIAMSSYLIAELGRKLTLNVQSTVYQKINSLVGMAPFEDPQFHNTIQLAAQSAQRGPVQILQIFTAFLNNMITMIAFFGLLISFSPLLLVAIVLSSVPQLYAQLRIGYQRFGIAQVNSPRERLVAYYGMILSGANFAKEVRLFNLSNYFLHAFRRVYQEIHRAERNQQARELRWNLVLATLASVVTNIAFVLVILQAVAGRISVGSVTLYISAVESMQNALAGIIFAMSQLKEGLLFYNQYNSLLELPQPLQIARSPCSVTPLKSGIRLINVSFRYSDQHAWVLHRVNLFIPAGRCTALVGENGAGKTTLVKLLTRLYDPTEGQILWDNIDIREFDPSELRCHIGAIFQDFIRYDLTVKENIGLGDVSHLANDSRVHEAAMRAGIHNTVQNLPKGYQTILSRWLAKDELGIDLSGGQWQKIANARMFMRNADLLILDEPTAALDPQAEYDIYSRFVDLTDGPTSLLITHRFSTVRMADVVAVLEGGHITEYGTHDELLSLKGTYTRLYNMQAERYL